MKYGIIPPYGQAPVESPQYASRFAKLAEAHGFESIWVVEHVVMAEEYNSVYPYDPSGKSPFDANVVQPDPLVWLTHVAAATSTIRLATGVLNLAQRNPLILAKELATLDQLSNGRVELGIGIGWVREEAEALGTNFDNRGRRTNEWIRILRELWQDQAASFQGEYLAFERMVCRPKPVQTDGIPIIVGGHSKAAARRAGRLGNGIFPLSVVGPKLEELLSVMRDTAKKADRNADALTLTTVGNMDEASAQYFSSVGADRMVAACPEPDLDKLEPRLRTFQETVIAKY